MRRRWRRVIPVYAILQTPRRPGVPPDTGLSLAWETGLPSFGNQPCEWLARNWIQRESHFGTRKSLQDP